MKSNHRLLYLAALFVLVLPLLIAGSAGAVYLPDGATQDSSSGGWDLPQDLGVCVTGIQAGGTLNIASSVTSRPDCIAITFPAYTAQHTTGGNGCSDTGNAEGAAHWWTNTCVDGSGNGISLKGLDRNSANCTAKGGTWKNACIASWQYAGRDAVYSSGQYVSGGFDQGFCYTSVDVTADKSTKAACVGTNSTTTPMLNPWVTIGTGNACIYSYGVNGGLSGSNKSGAWTAIKKMDGSTTSIAAHGTIPNLTSYNMGQCLLAGLTWNNYAISGGSDSTIFPASSATVAKNVVAGNWDCLRCHNSVSQNNTVAERWKESYLKQGHKNMLRKVTAGYQWGGPDANGNMALYTGSAYSDGTINWTNATAGSSNLPLLYIFGDWMAPAPAGLDVIVNNSGHALYNGTSVYSCSACHATGFSNQTPGYCAGDLSKATQSACDSTYGASDTTGATSVRSKWTEAGVCSKSSYLNQADCVAASATWYPTNGLQASLYSTGGAEPVATYPAVDWNLTSGTKQQLWSPRWDQNGIQCSRCHMVTFPEIYDSTNSGASGNGHDFSPAIGTGAAISDLCFSCHQSTQKTNLGTGLDVDLNNPTSPGVNVTSTTADFSGHPIGEEFLNSPHQRYTGTMTPNAVGKYEIGTFTGGAFVPSGTFNTAFNDGFCSQSTYVDGSGNPAEVKTQADCTNLAGGTWNYRSDQGSCTSCHDVHNSMFEATEAEKSMKKECETCHIDANGGVGPNKTAVPQVVVANMTHPQGANTPWDSSRFDSPCETCHMPKASATGFPLHLWRMSTDANYSTFPTYAQFSGNTQKTANTAPDSTGYANAIWVDLSLACGQCHYTTGANYVSGNPVFTKPDLAAAADALHNGGDAGTNNSNCLQCHATGEGGAPVIDPTTGATHHYVGTTTCTTCHLVVHQGILPGDGTVNPAYNSTTRLDTPGTGCLYCHGPASSSTGPIHWTSANYPNGIEPDNALGAGTDNHHSDHGSCTTCHGNYGGERPSNVSATLYGGVRQYLDTNGGQFCLTCHSNSGTYGRHHAVQAIVDAGMNCMITAGCHVPGKPGVSGVMPEDKAACLLCHSTYSFTSTTSSINVRTVTQGTNHHNGECTTCHKAEPFTYLATGDLSTVGTTSPISFMDGTITSGKINDSIITSCLTCHGTDQVKSDGVTAVPAIHPKLNLYGGIDDASGNQADNHHRGHSNTPVTGGDPGMYCLGCHGSANTGGSSYVITGAGLSTTTVSGQHGYTGGADATSSLCKACHGSETIQSGATQNHHAGACLTCHQVAAVPGGAGATDQCVNGPANTACDTTHTVSYKPVNVASWTDCTACHSADGTNGPATGTTHHVITDDPWTANNFTATPATGTCAACHADAGVEPYEAGTTTVKTCADCHTHEATSINYGMTSVTCDQCHTTQGGKLPVLSPVPVCANCHTGVDSTWATVYGANMHLTQPTASFTGTCDTTTSGLMIYNATSSTCPSGSCTYGWNFGGSGTATGGTTATPTFQYASSGTYTVTLTVTDNAPGGASAQQQYSFTTCTVNQPPTCGRSSVKFGTQCTGGSTNSICITDASSDDTSGATVSFSWGDNKIDSGLALLTTALHTYTYAGNYTIRQSVKDANGAVTDCPNLYVPIPGKFKVTVNTSGAVASALVKVSLGGVLKAQGYTNSAGTYTSVGLTPDANYSVSITKGTTVFNCAGSGNPVTVDLSTADNSVTCTHTP